MSDVGSIHDWQFLNVYLQEIEMCLPSIHFSIQNYNVDWDYRKYVMNELLLKCTDLIYLLTVKYLQPTHLKIIVK